VTVRWLDRGLMVGPLFCLCLTEKGYQSALRSLKVPRHRWREWLLPGMDATTHSLECNGNEAHIVCLHPGKKDDVIVTYALLVHEAVHIWQAYRKSIGEDEPASEQEAYSIQHISQELMSAFNRHRKRR
jgi:hypothetical protein